MMFKIKKESLIIIIIMLTSMVMLSAQEKFKFPASSDLGLNISGVITSFIGNTSSDLNPESFPITVKLNRKKHAFRLGIGFDFNQSDAKLFEVEQVFFNNFTLNSRFGVEKKKYLGHKIGFFYGMDIIGTTSYKEDIVSNQIDISTITENSFGVGGGPIYGFEYYLNKSMYFGTEGSFYFLYRYTDRNQVFDFNPSTNAQRITRTYDTRFISPTRLYFMIRF